MDTKNIINIENDTELYNDERKVADLVADEILEKDDKKDHKFLIFLLLFIILLSFLVSSISFAVIYSYDYGSSSNNISSGSILFSFNENSTAIEIYDALPVTDEVGKTSVKEGEYLDFSVSVGYSKNVEISPIKYEVSLVPIGDNTLDDEYIRVYLTEDNEPVFIKNKEINNFSELDDNKDGTGKVLLTKEVSSDGVYNYRLRLWLSSKYEITGTSEVFKCKVHVYTYE